MNRGECDRTLDSRYSSLRRRKRTASRIACRHNPSSLARAHERLCCIMNGNSRHSNDSQRYCLRFQICSTASLTTALPQLSLSPTRHVGTLRVSARLGTLRSLRLSRKRQNVNSRAKSEKKRIGSRYERLRYTLQTYSSRHSQS